MTIIPRDGRFGVKVWDPGTRRYRWVGTYPTESEAIQAERDATLRPGRDVPTSPEQREKRVQAAAEEIADYLPDWIAADGRTARACAQRALAAADAVVAVVACDHAGVEPDPEATDG